MQSCSRILVFVVVVAVLFVCHRAERVAVTDSFYKQWLIGQYDPHEHIEFTTIPANYTIPAPTKEYMFSAIALKYLKQMIDKA